MGNAPKLTREDMRDGYQDNLYYHRETFQPYLLSVDEDGNEEFKSLEILRDDQNYDRKIPDGKKLLQG